MFALHLNATSLFYCLTVRQLELLLHMTHSTRTLKIDVQAEYTFILKWYYNRFIMGLVELMIHCKVPCVVAPDSFKGTLCTDSA